MMPAVPLVTQHHNQQSSASSYGPVWLHVIGSPESMVSVIGTEACCVGTMGMFTLP